MKMRRHPFTLLEVLIASTIFLGLAIVLFVYAGQTTQSWSKLQVRRNQLNELLALDRAIDTVLPNIIPFTWPQIQRLRSATCPHDMRFTITNSKTLQ